jgi:hypothetical protein
MGDTGDKSGPRNGQRHDSSGGTAKRLSLRCTRCRFTIVVGSVNEANGLGWVNISTENGTGLCRACRAETDR